MRGHADGPRDGHGVAGDDSAAAEAMMALGGTGAGARRHGVDRSFLSPLSWRNDDTVK